MSCEVEEGTLGLIRELLGGVKAGQFLLSFAGLNKGGQHEGCQRQTDVESLECDHLFEEVLCGEWAGSVHGGPGRDRRRNQRGGRRSALAEAPGRDHDEWQHQVLDPQTILEKQIGHDRSSGQQGAEFPRTPPVELGPGRSWQQAQEEGRHQQHPHRVARPPDGPGRPEAAARHGAR